MTSGLSTQGSEVRPISTSAVLKTAKSARPGGRSMPLLENAGPAPNTADHALMLVSKLRAGKTIVAMTGLSTKKDPPSVVVSGLAETVS
jgi:hypothetical protein